MTQQELEATVNLYEAIIVQAYEDIKLSNLNKDAVKFLQSEECNEMFKLILKFKYNRDNDE